MRSLLALLQGCCDSQQSGGKYPNYFIHRIAVLRNIISFSQYAFGSNTAQESYMNITGRLGGIKRSFALKYKSSKIEIGRKFSEKLSIKLHEYSFSDIIHFFGNNQLHNISYINAFDV